MLLHLTSTHLGSRKLRLPQASPQISRSTAIALFKELTDVAEGSKIVVDMDFVRYLQRIKDMTSIYFGNDDAVKLKETPNEILMLRAL